MKIFVSRTQIPLVLILLLFFLPTSVCRAQVNQKDSLSLVALYLAYYGENWTNHSGWMEAGVPVSQWYGVTVDPATNRVTGLELPNNNIVAVFPESVSDEGWLGEFFINLLSDIPRLMELLAIIDQIFDLPGAPLGELRVINLSNNRISGNLPLEIDQVTYLQYLNMNNNRLSGSIPTPTGNLDYLEVLDLGNNRFSGSIPENLGNAGSLTYLNLQQNNLNGGIPASLGSLINLEHLDLRNNQLSGTLPSQLWNLTNLEFLSLRGNNLEGRISSNIGNLVNLTILNLSDNQFSNVIPDAFANLTQLSQLLLHENQFSGAVPPSIGQISGLMNLNISDNLLSDLPVLSNVWNDFICYNNYLTFEDFEMNIDVLRYAIRPIIHPQKDFGVERDTTVQAYEPFFISIPCPGENNRYTWYKDGAYHSGPFDTDTLYFSSIQWDDAGQYHVQVTNTRVDEALAQNQPAQNNLVPNLELFSRTTTIHLEYSCLYADSLALVALYNATGGPNWTRKDNWLTGPVKDWWGIELNQDGCHVTQIDLRTGFHTGNNLIGQIPAEIGNLPELINLYLPNNQLSGELPEDMKNLSNLSNLHLSDNDLSGPLTCMAGRFNPTEYPGSGRKRLFRPSTRRTL